MKKLILCAFFSLIAVLPLVADDFILWQHANWEGRISRNGLLEQIIFKGEKRDTIPFFRNTGKAGPSFYINEGKQDTVGVWKPCRNLVFTATLRGVTCELAYVVWKNQPALRITMTNNRHVPFQPVKAGLKLGIDTYMDKYPDWFGKYFPTLMQNEKTHFYGYLETPKNHVLGIVSPDPVASWSVDYNLGYQDPAPFWFMGHRIESLNLDLMNALPLPDRNPQHLWQLKQGESRTWTIAFIDISSLDKFESEVHKVSGLPMLRIPQTTVVPGEKASFEVLGAAPEITVLDDKGTPISYNVHSVGTDLRRVECRLPKVGLYTVRVKDKGKVAEGVLSAHTSWELTLENARAGAWKYHQKATSHIESWYGFHSAFLAAKYFPDKALDEKLRRRFDYLFNLLHDTVKMEPKYHVSRIQNTSGTIGLLMDKYQAYGDIKDVENASRLADWLIGHWQRKDGAYVNHGTVYTSVIYVAKSILELVQVEEELAKTDSKWGIAAERHYKSAKRAIDQLVAAQGDFQTEGEATFEDGMISCSALQIGMLGLMQDNAKARKHYTDAMLKILNSHDCLTQLKVSDARRRGGTMRYWEAQYDVQMLPNMFNSPHGWSAWRAYATYYAYLLTGNERWLKETYNAAGSFSNLIDYKTGDLRWAFVVDPYIKVTQACSPDKKITADSLSFGNPHPYLYDTQTFVIGEQYVNMVSDWQGVNTQDNDVHEVFKFIGEAFLTNAFIGERPDGSLYAYNCKVTKDGKGGLKVVAAERQIVNLHCNLRKKYNVTFCGKSRKLPAGFLGWAFGHDVYKNK